MMASATRVKLALTASGLRKAGTPLLTASIPVSAVQPDEKARSSRWRRAKGARSGMPDSAAWTGCGAIWPQASCHRPTPTMIAMAATKL